MRPAHPAMHLHSSRSSASSPGPTSMLNGRGKRVPCMLLKVILLPEVAEPAIGAGGQHPSNTCTPPWGMVMVTGSARVFSRRKVGFTQWFRAICPRSICVDKRATAVYKGKHPSGGKGVMTMYRIIRPFT